MVDVRPKPTEPAPQPDGMHVVAAGGAQVPGDVPGGPASADSRRKRVASRSKRPSRYSPGELVGEKYRLKRILGRGGMGEVWEARHEHLNTDLAIKFLDRLPDSDEGNVSIVLERFRFEAQISARLGSRTRNIVAVYDAGSHAGIPYLVMEYVHGRTLESVIDELGMVEPERFADILDQVADALSVAHELGIVHRDIKPSNIMLVEPPRGPDGVTAHGGRSGDGAGSLSVTAKLADFGVAKALRTDLAIDRPKDTSEGLLVGSPAYMSPEQLKCDGQLDARSDVWSLGVVAYEALTGWPPFSGTSIADLIVAISTRTADAPSSIRASLPRAIDSWFHRALAKDPGARFATPKEMAGAFRAALRLRARRPPRMIALGLAAAAAITTIAVLVSRLWTAAPAEAASTEAAPVAPAATSVVAAPPPIAAPPPSATAEERAPVAATPPSAAPKSGPRAPRAGVRPAAASAAPAPPPPPTPAAAEPLPPREIEPGEIQ
jgi:eukaryotic-like serine/threonine-protein kinase